MEFNIRDIKEKDFADAVSGAWEKLNNEERFSIRQSYINYLAAQDGLFKIIEDLKKVAEQKPKKQTQETVEQPKEQPVEEPVQTETIKEPPVDPQTNQKIDLGPGQQ